ncbi:MAG TPA: hypothetical protein VFS20_21385 [Longimicrobium sp.]|nr:hypothetical protein [Longimicrobium sp.]
MKKITAGVFAAAATALLAGTAQAQLPTITPFAFEARAGVALPTGDMNEDTGPGLALSGSVTYHAIPLIGIYAGGSYARFSADLEEDVDGHATDTGFDVGARIGIPTPLIPIDPWIKAGLVVHRVSLSDDNVSIDSDWGTGYEVGGGLGFGFGPVSISPGITYVRYNSDFGDVGEDEEFTVSYIRADVGVRIRI